MSDFKSLPLCDDYPKSTGCSWYENGAIKARLGVLYEALNVSPKKYFLVDGLVRDDGVVETAHGVYPAAAEENDTLEFNMKMNIWELSAADEEKISSLESDTLTRLIKRVEAHEAVHWAIFEWALNSYVRLLNNPPENRNMTWPSSNELVNYVKTKVNERIDIIGLCAQLMQERFHELERANLQRVDITVEDQIIQCDVSVNNENQINRVPYIPGCDW